MRIIGGILRIIYDSYDDPLSHKDRKTERQKDRKTERQKDRKTEERREKQKTEATAVRQSVVNVVVVVVVVVVIVLS